MASAMACVCQCHSVAVFRVFRGYGLLLSPPRSESRSRRSHQDDGLDASCSKRGTTSAPVPNTAAGTT